MRGKMADINTNGAKIKVSGFKSAKNTKPVGDFLVNDILAGIKDGKFRRKV